MAMKNKIQSKRSPRYPRVSLNKAIEYLEKLYDGAHRSVLDSDTAVRVMGFTNPSGASAIVIGAIRQYGLVEGLRSDVCVSDLGMKILEPSSPIEQASALKEAALKPEAFQKVLSKFNNTMPNSDDAIRSFLIRELGFSKAGADDCIASLRETFRGLEIDSHSEPAFNDRSQESEVSGEEKSISVDPVNFIPAVASDIIKLPLSKECNVELRFVGPVTEAAIDRLINHISLMKDVWSEG